MSWRSSSLHPWWKLKFWNNFYTHSEPLFGSRVHFVIHSSVICSVCLGKVLKTLSTLLHTLSLMDVQTTCMQSWLFLCCARAGWYYQKKEKDFIMRSSMFFEDTKADTEAGFKRFIAKGAWKTCRNCRRGPGRVKISGEWLRLVVRWGCRAGRDDMSQKAWIKENLARGGEKARVLMEQ